VDIREDDLSGPEIANLLEEHLANMREITPPGSVHALDLKALRASNITFWSAWENEQLIGCGALKELNANSAEIKSMRTAEGHRRKGVASKMVEHILQTAERKGYQYLYVETGSFPAFEPARQLYKRYGFEPTAPFADYIDDPNSTFMVKQL